MWTSTTPSPACSPAALAAAVAAPFVLHGAHQEGLCVTGEEQEMGTMKTSTD